MGDKHKLKVVDVCHVSPPPGSVLSTSLPITYFDIPWLRCFPIKRLFFYEFPHPTQDFMELVLPNLKNSLSLTLQHFFPFASKLVCPPQPQKPHILYLDGNSVPLTIVEVSGDFNFNHLIADYRKDVKDSHPFVPHLPSELILEDGTRSVPLMAIQVTVFHNCGLSIGVTFHHVAADGRSFHHFMKSWASICRSTEGDYSITLPFHDRSVVKDPNGIEMNLLTLQWSLEKEFKKDTGVSHDILADNLRATFVLSLAHIDKLKQWVSGSVKCKSNELVSIHISTFVVASALIWVCLVKSEEESKAKEFSDNYTETFYHFAFPADCRNRFELSIPETYFGNCLDLCFVSLKRKELVGENGIVEAAKAIGKKVRELETVALRGADRWILDYKEKMESGKIISLAGSPKLGVYETNFGWGKPKKSEVVHIDTTGSFALSDCKDGESGIEVSLVLDRTQMNNFNGYYEELLTGP
ncbi:Anthocyanin 5-aromatic acyltransferase [Quillaja saponaria]|uniref:Anthocyanin 5-aromatic acyltransferase n=1 Tax=Quillaja saponaria TaxID=32244 RepID=A0AAD7PZ75_QUISA|nr:Anthocyanin 5-aromatic acyltransferase [Quillaja saponaria]